MKIPLDKIIFDPFQARIHMSEEELTDLASSIKAVGQRDAIHVYAYQDQYVVYDGERRVRAMRANGSGEIEARQDGVLNSLDPSDPTVLKMRERAYQANDQRVDLTSMERGRALLKMLRDGASVYLDPKNHQISSKVLANAINRAPQTVQRLITQAKSEEELYGTDALVVRPTENAAVYLQTASLAEFPEIRKSLIELVSNETTGLSHGKQDLNIVSQALATLPASKDQIFEMIGKKIAPDVIKQSALEAATLPEDLRSQYLQLTLDEKVSREEAPKLAEIMRSDEGLARYALDLKTDRNATIEDIKRSVEKVSLQPEFARKHIIEEKIVFVEDTSAFRLSLPDNSVIPPELLKWMQESPAGISSDAFKTAKRLRENWESHMALILAATGATCPKCGKGRLIWDCCHLDISEAKEIAKTNFEKRN